MLVSPQEVYTLSEKLRQVYETNKKAYYKQKSLFFTLHPSVLIWPTWFDPTYSTNSILLPFCSLYFQEHWACFYLKTYQVYSYLRVFTLLFPAWNEMCSVSFVWLSPFHHSGNQWSERPTLTTRTLLSPSPRHMCFKSENEYQVKFVQFPKVYTKISNLTIVQFHLAIN